jgi:hypothetical protein
LYRVGFYFRQIGSDLDRPATVETDWSRPGLDRSGLVMNDAGLSKYVVIRPGSAPNMKQLISAE